MRVHLWMLGQLEPSTDSQISHPAHRIDIRRAQLMGEHARLALFMAGWEIAVVITVIQVLIWYFSDNDLQTWFEKSTFGKAPNTPPWEAGKQHEEFEKALKGVGLQANEGSE
jgi:hypothetical protein